MMPLSDVPNKFKFKTFLKKKKNHLVTKSGQNIEGTLFVLFTDRNLSQVLIITLLQRILPATYAVSFVLS